MVKLRADLELEGLAAPAHQAAVEALRQKHHHTIRFVRRLRGTCATFTFGLLARAQYRAIARYEDIFAGREFVEWLVACKLTEVQRPRSGSLVLYFDDRRWKHIGELVGSDRVCSKWGAGFPVYEHDLWDVPASYGHRVRYFEAVRTSDAFEWFLEFAQ